jgi:hypothetical protein
LADSLETQFHPVNDQLAPAVIDVVKQAMCAPPRELELTSPSKVLDSIKGLSVGKAPGPNGVPNRILRRLPKLAITFLMKVFNTVLRRQYFQSARKHNGMISIQKSRKNPTLLSSYRPVFKRPFAFKTFHALPQFSFWETKQLSVVNEL